MEGFLSHSDGYKLMCEVLYLYGVMLFLVDIKISHVVREKFIIVYYRHKGWINIININYIIKLFSSFGYVIGY